MSTMNIAGTQPVDDPEYRYKMPRLITKIEGRGNGIKTLVVNCHDVATSLHRSTAEVCKFFGTELGAQSKYDEKTDRAIVNGAFEVGMMQTHLSKYIEGFVLCPGCRLPESKYKFKGQSIFHKCYACGAVEPVDMNHKLTTFIMKEHTAAKRAGKKTDKDDKKKKKKDRKEKFADGPEKDGNSSPKENKDKKDRKDKKKKKNGKEKSTEEVEWHTDLSPEAVAARAAEAEAIEAGARAAMVNGSHTNGEGEIVATLDHLQVHDEDALELAITKLSMFMESEPTTDAIHDELCRLQTYAALSISDRLVIVFRASFDDQFVAKNQVSKSVSILGKLVTSQHDQYRLIALCEHMCAMKYPEIISQFPVLLKLLYDEDLIDEECLFGWLKTDIRKQYADPIVSDDSNAKLKQHLQVFTDWLENAEEETDDDE
uniref:Eukaryotic translation initiation factor 5 putative n=1 Tax=Albugo laibachii Nc14 TaxID=890382 RepID=F0X090_9STRA|nr:eukaryotic translation initiation factor 5 putative [Albugo laibachii Nc14]|eukprot:CCA27172.1 eukaryotic translation initiation factor 5 putative [Albugo laibachii Nc14]